MDGIHFFMQLARLTVHSQLFALSDPLIKINKGCFIVVMIEASLPLANPHDDPQEMLV